MLAMKNILIYSVCALHDEVNIMLTTTGPSLPKNYFRYKPPYMKKTPPVLMHLLIYRSIKFLGKMFKCWRWSRVHRRGVWKRIALCAKIDPWSHFTVAAGAWLQPSLCMALPAWHVLPPLPHPNPHPTPAPPHPWNNNKIRRPRYFAILYEI